ncbi:cell division protein FtsK [Peptococcaceae bacterium SCADC1_2_3]|nr:cell division protein FtsK [Peptococcaceae bacterium SCADC1_2_3]KFI35444.1 cell division protein FtsK [Peptococcaceae bacterium SCADC1_2_3]
MLIKPLGEDLKFEIYGLAVITLAILALASLISPLTGTLGQALKQGLVLIAGKGGYFVPVLIFLLGLKIMREKSQACLNSRFFGFSLLFLTILIFLHLPYPSDKAFLFGQEGKGGGLLGAAGFYVLQKGFGLAGSRIILGALGFISLLLIAGMPTGQLGQDILNRLVSIWHRGGHFLSNFLFEEVVGEETKEKGSENKNSPLTALGARSVFSKNAPAGDREPKSASREKQYLPPNLSQNPGAKGVKTACALANGQPYRLPAPEILASIVQPKSNAALDKEISEKTRVLEDTLNNFGITIKVNRVNVGPTVTRYEFQPPPGVKVSRIVGLADDITLAMAASRVRIEAPIPGKAAVGIEIPNREISSVYLRELIETKEFASSSSRLTVVLGRDIAGTPIITDLSKMPHLLIAGATGAGKSVCINTLISSILFKATPDEVKFLLIDPKMVELTIYSDIPHLISPVVTNVKKTAGALHWAVKEMEHRYELFAACGAKDITRYNEIMCKLPPENQCLPFIVVIIDELADLMMIAPNEVEDAICRLAQMARAAGIHLVLATQRPSVDVITGLIKANIPSRISFAVTSQMDSRTILDMGGAEKLVGKGDMLFLPIGASKPVRLQGAFLTDKDITTLTNFIKEQMSPVFNEEVTLVQPELKNNNEKQDDELFPQAVNVLLENGNASVSLLQRRLRIGYSRAARLIDLMEDKGIVSTYEGNKPRTILVNKEQFNQKYH